jgi:hypothetical protein
MSNFDQLVTEVLKSRRFDPQKQSRFKQIQAAVAQMGDISPDLYFDDENIISAINRLRF